MRDDKQYYVYIMTNKSDTAFYTSVTNSLIRRVLEHKQQSNDGFTKHYRLNKLVYFEAGSNVEGAILREKQIKAGSRQDKINLIKSINPGWNDLAEAIME